MNQYKDIAQTAWGWLETISLCSETDDPNISGVTRLSATKEHQAAIDKLTDWMQVSGMSVRMDHAANLIGRYESSEPNAKTLIFGSHQDTVPNGGKYDGILGVILPIALVHFFSRQAIRFPFNIDVVAFSDEEGSRFQTTLLGSKAIAGTLDLEMLSATDNSDISMYQALKLFGCDPELIPNDAYHKDDVIGFVELHIEQGPQLETCDLPVGIVTAITGIERHTLSIYGKAGHAGTVPMTLRQDSLVGAAKVIVLLDEVCKREEDLVGVVGKISNHPNGVNVIPQQTELTIELRSPNDTSRFVARQEIYQEIKKLMHQSQLDYHLTQIYEQSAVECSSRLSKPLEGAINQSGIDVKYLFSGAGHDGLAMCQLTDIAMLFLRCKNGLSHHPEEAISLEDLAVAAEVLFNFCKQLQSQH